MNQVKLEEATGSNSKILGKSRIHLEEFSEIFPDFSSILWKDGDL
jgi:hypothetical protein